MMSVRRPRDLLGSFLHIHQFVQTELPSRMIEKQIDILINFSIAASDRAKQEKVFNAKLLKLGFV